MRPWVRIPIASSTTSAPEPLQSNGTRIGRFLPTACQLHLKSSILKPLLGTCATMALPSSSDRLKRKVCHWAAFRDPDGNRLVIHRSEEHTSELQSLTNLVCRLLLEKKKKNI